MEDLSSPIVESELSGLEYIPGILQVKWLFIQSSADKIHKETETFV